jgi:hypothetical protein
MTVRIAMWSGPRNISTALMRSFGARDDCTVVDEPLYAHYLRATGLDHPGRDQVIASQPAQWRDAVEQLLAPLDAKVQYQKHMTHHLLPGIGTGWLAGLRNAYLIRDPARVIASYARVRQEPTLADLGFEQQTRIYDEFPGPVVDADDLLADPPAVLPKLCAALGIDYQEGMLHWPPGPRPTDGVWAPHWYASVQTSTGFTGPPAGEPRVPDRLAALLAAARPHYRRLAASKI